MKMYVPFLCAVFFIAGAITQSVINKRGDIKVIGKHKGCTIQFDEVSEEFSYGVAAALQACGLFVQISMRHPSVSNYEYRVEYKK